MAKQVFNLGEPSQDGDRLTWKINEPLRDPRPWWKRILFRERLYLRRIILKG